jgi:hypothetical protein
MEIIENVYNPLLLALFTKLMFVTAFDSSD